MPSQSKSIKNSNFIYVMNNLINFIIGLAAAIGAFIIMMCASFLVDILFHSYYEV